MQIQCQRKKMSDFNIDELEIFTEESDKKDFYDSDGT